MSNPKTLRLKTGLRTWLTLFLLFFELAECGFDGGTLYHRMPVRSMRKKRRKGKKYTRENESEEIDGLNFQDRNVKILERLNAVGGVLYYLFDDSNTDKPVADPSNRIGPIRSNIPPNHRRVSPVFVPQHPDRFNNPDSKKNRVPVQPYHYTNQKPTKKIIYPVYIENIRDEVELPDMPPILLAEEIPVTSYAETASVLEAVEPKFILDDENYAYHFKNANAEEILESVEPKIDTVEEEKPFNNNENEYNTAIYNKRYEKVEETNNNGVRFTPSLIKKDPPEDPDPEEDGNRKKKESSAFALNFLSYLGFFVPTISLSPYTSFSTFVIEVLSRKYPLFKIILFTILPVTLTIEMFETISYWLKNSVYILISLFNGTAFTFMFIAELLIHMLPLIGLWHVRTGRKLKFQWLHVPMLFLTAWIYTIYAVNKFYSMSYPMLMCMFLIPLVTIYLYNLSYFDPVYKKVIDFAVTETKKPKKKFKKYENEFKAHSRYLL